MAKINFVRTNRICLEHHTVTPHLAIRLRHFAEIQIGISTGQIFFGEFIESDNTPFGG